MDGFDGPGVICVVTTTPEWMTEPQLAEWLQISEVKLRKDRWRGDGMPYTKLGRAVRYHVPTVRAWLDRNGVSP